MIRTSPRGEDHASYRKHRQQMWTQILLPVMLAALLILAVVVLASMSAFGGQGDLSRWAAISAIWLILPGLLIELVALAALVTAIFLIAKLHGSVPRYSHRAQQIFRRVESSSKRAAEMVRSPRLAAQGFAGFVRNRFERRAWTQKR
jgi:hypothetical protein